MPAMRLRLKIQRNELPTVSVLWPVTDTQLKSTMAALLEQVDKAFPLESETWGFEHYAVTVDGFECLHYQELGDVCRHEDEVSIRPLNYAETRARTLTGRNQITPDGRHLIDGVPFGRPALRGVVRPDVRIPPRKRRRLMEVEEDDAAAAEANAMALVRTEGDEDELDEDELDEYEPDEDELDKDDEDFDMIEESEEGEASDTSSSEDDDDSPSDDASSDDAMSVTDSTSDSGSDDNSSSSEGSWDGIASGPPEPPSRKAARQTELGKRMTFLEDLHKSHAPQSNVASSKKRKSPATENDDEAKVVQPTPTLPGEGKETTKARNARRRDAKRLAHFRRVGLLDAGATIADLHQWEAGNKMQVTPQADGMAEKDTSTKTPDRLSTAEDRSTPKPAELDEQVVSSSRHAKLEQQRRRLLEDIANGGVDVSGNSIKRKFDEVDEDEAPEELSAKEPTSNRASPSAQLTAVEAIGDFPEKQAGVGATAMIPPSVARRSKLDLAGSKRMLFGSLGVRVPRTQEEKEALQKKLGDRAKQRTAAPTGTHVGKELPAEPVPELEEEDPEAWRSKIDLTAVECCDEGVTLSMPPFPFHQRWDPQYRKKKSKARTSQTYAASQKRQRDKGDYGGFVETYDKYNIGGNGDALDYDEAEEAGEEYWEEGALLEDDEAFDEDDSGKLKAQSAIVDDFPPLPADLTTLPRLAEADAQKDDYITYTELVMSAATSWAPMNLTRTVQLLGKDEEGWQIKLALRDLRPREFDEEGKRVYSKFEMEGLSEDEDEPRERTVLWVGLNEVRLLLREKGTDGVASGLYSQQDRHARRRTSRHRYGPVEATEQRDEDVKVDKAALRTWACHSDLLCMMDAKAELERALRLSDCQATAYFNNLRRYWRVRTDTHISDYRRILVETLQKPVLDQEAIDKIQTLSYRWRTFEMLAEFEMEGQPGRYRIGFLLNIQLFLQRESNPGNPMGRSRGRTTVSHAVFRRLSILRADIALSTRFCCSALSWDKLSLGLLQIRTAGEDYWRDTATRRRPVRFLPSSTALWRFIGCGLGSDSEEGQDEDGEGNAAAIVPLLKGQEDAPTAMPIV